MNHPGSGRSRLSVFVVLALGVLFGPVGVAQADDASVDPVRIDVFGTPGQVLEVAAPKFNLDFGGTRHLTPDGSFETTLNPNGSPYVSYEPETWSVPSTWGTTSSRFSFRPTLKVTLPTTLGRTDQFVTLTAATDTCPAGFGDCITGDPLTVQIRMEVKPRPLSNVKATGDSTGIDFTWTPTPDQSQIAAYHIERTDMDARTTTILDPYDRNATSYRDAAARPGTQYCYRIFAYWLGTGGAFNTSDASLVCGYVNRAPGAPGATVPKPTLTNGPTTVSWEDAVDPDGNNVTYTLEHKDADDGDNWTLVREGFTGNSLPVVEKGGTWQYRVRATDHLGVAGPWSEIGPEHKADTIGPGVPKLSYDKTPVAGNWFKDSVTVSFSDAVDTLLPDGSEGGGVAFPEGYPKPITLSTHGVHRVAEMARDRVGNGGAIVPTFVRVDTKSPNVRFTACPAEVLQNDAQEIAWTADDEDGSGIDGATSGSIKIASSTIGPRTETITVKDRVGHQATAECTLNVYKNTAPPVVQNVVSSEPFSGDGDFKISWGKSVDPEDDPVDYTVEEVGSATPLIEGLDATSYSLQDVPEGTHTYRITAFDKPRRWHEGAATVTVKVDKSAPTAPEASTDRAPEYGDWFKDRVTVSFSGSSDPDLADKTPGSGVAPTGYTVLDPLTASGDAKGTATDRAGNPSAVTTKTVKVDGTAPSAEMTCPSGSLVGEPGATAGWTATDGESGVKGAASRAIALDTSKPGTFPVEGPAPEDNVGHEGVVPKCTYSVGYPFAGFLSPINGAAVNAGKTGRTYPIKWRLQHYDGTLLSDAEAQALVADMSAGQKEMTCGSFALLPTDELTESTTGETVLRYDATADQFIYNYKAPSTGGCFVLGIRKADGANTQQVNFTFTR